jgi:uncharacterized protein YukE
MSTGEIFYHKAGMSDFSGTTMALSQQLEQIIHEAEQLLAGSQDFFDTPEGSQQYIQIMALIKQGIHEGQQALNSQSGIIEDIGNNMSGTDSHVGSAISNC